MSFYERGVLLCCIFTDAIYTVSYHCSALTSEGRPLRVFRTNIPLAPAALLQREQPASTSVRMGCKVKHEGHRLNHKTR